MRTDRDKRKANVRPARKMPSDALVLAAMGLVSASIAISFRVEAGLSLYAAIFTGVTIFAVMAFVHMAVARIHKAEETSRRLSRVEERVASLAEQIKATESAAQDLLQMNVDGGEDNAFAPPPAAPAATVSGFDCESLGHEIASEVGDLRRRLDQLQNNIEQETQEQKGHFKSEMRLMETLVKQLAEQIASNAHREAQHAAAKAVEAAQATSGDADAAAGRMAAGERPEPGNETTTIIDAFDLADMDSEMLNVIRQSIETNKIDLYLQPIVELPHRRDRYYEALTRLRNVTGDIIYPESYIRVAEQAGIMPIIDNVMLFRSIKVVNRLANAPGSKALFCNISPHSLWDPEFFPEFIGFMQQNKHLAGNIVFEFSQSMLNRCGPVEHESLRMLSALGFRLSLDQVERLNINYQLLQDRGFRFMKLAADLLLHRLEEAGGRIHAVDMSNYLRRYGIELIVEKIEDERTLSRLLSCNISLGQGNLFSEPRLVRSEIYADKQTRTTAA